MAKIIKRENKNIGFLNSTVFEGEEAQISIVGFESTIENGNFYPIVENLPTQALKEAYPGKFILPSTIDHLLLVLEPNQMTVYVNEIEIVSKIKVKNSKKKGEVVTTDDILDITSLELKNIHIPTNAGFLFVFSFGWHKAIVYDFRPLHEKFGERDYDIDEFLGNAYKAFVFYKFYSLEDHVVDQMIEQLWFPFVGLGTSTINTMVYAINRGKPLEGIINTIEADFNTNLDKNFARIISNEMMDSHSKFIEIAINHFKNGDYISAVSVLYPRIEGVFQTAWKMYKSNGRPKQKQMRQLLTSLGNDISEFLLPDKFQKYLEKVYFADSNDNSISRNAIAHGISDAKDFDKVSFILGIYTLDQILFHLPKK